MYQEQEGDGLEDILKFLNVSDAHEEEVAADEEAVDPVFLHAATLGVAL